MFLDCYIYQASQSSPFFCSLRQYQPITFFRQLLLKLLDQQMYQYHLHMRQVFPDFTLSHYFFQLVDQSSPNRRQVCYRRLKDNL
jgi:hypothetical protein